jgi:cyclic pyranopterin phosphate synthase
MLANHPTMNAAVTSDHPGLTDQFGRRIDYVRLSVTDRCDLRCSYCMPEGFKGFEEPEHWLNFDEIERLIGAFARLGVSHIRLTGGEPLLRRDIAGLSQRIAALSGIHDLSLSTNATQLDRHAHALKAAGVTRLNVSLDSLQQARVEKINGRDVLAKVMAGLATAQEAGFAPIKLNMVALAGSNDDEIDEMVAFCMQRGFVLRLIESMPMGATGQNAEYLDLQPVKERLRRQFDLIETTLPGAGPARYLGTADGRFNVGFITPISQHFCETCNRVRVAVDGTAYMCLGQDEKFEFRPLLRGGCSDAELEAAIVHAINLKPERHEFREAPHKILRFMSMTGG